MAELNDYYTSRYSGEEIDAALFRAASGGPLDAALDMRLRVDADQNLTEVQQQQAQKNIGVTWPCNRNLLDNWYFGRPVNQRGQTEYVTAWQYGLDRWLCAGDGKCWVDSGYCTFFGAIDQGLSVEMSEILGRTFTASVLFRDGTLISGTSVNADNSADIPFWSGVQKTHFSLNKTDLSGHRRLRMYFVENTDILATKLELGDTQTLAHREGDKWVLNEIPDFGEELRRCQRYFYNLNLTHAFGWTYSPQIANFFVSLPVTLRAIPSVQFAQFGVINTVSGSAAVTGYEVKDASSNGVVIDAHNSAGVLKTATPAVWHSFSAFLSADL